jgi:hypothetical protein
VPVSKYRSVTEMPRVPASDPSRLASRIRALWNRSFLLTPPSYPRGVSRFRDIAEANAARERATLRRMRATRNG